MFKEPGQPTQPTKPNAGFQFTETVPRKTRESSVANFRKLTADLEKAKSRNDLEDILERLDVLKTDVRQMLEDSREEHVLSAEDMENTRFINFSEQEARAAFIQRYLEKRAELTSLEIRYTGKPADGDRTQNEAFHLQPNGGLDLRFKYGAGKKIRLDWQLGGSVDDDVAIILMERNTGIPVSVLKIPRNGKKGSETFSDIPGFDPEKQEWDIKIDSLSPTSK